MDRRLKKLNRSRERFNRLYLADKRKREVSEEVSEGVSEGVSEEVSQVKKDNAVVGII